MKTRIKVVETTSSGAKTIVYIPQAKKRYDGYWTMGSLWFFLFPVFGQMFLMFHILSLIEDNFYRRFDVSELDKILECELDDEITRDLAYDYYAFSKQSDAKIFLINESMKLRRSMQKPEEKIDTEKTYYTEYEEF